MKCTLVGIAAASILVTGAAGAGQAANRLDQGAVGVPGDGLRTARAGSRKRPNADHRLQSSYRLGRVYVCKRQYRWVLTPRGWHRKRLGIKCGYTYNH